MRRLTDAHGGGDFHSCHLECAVANEHVRPKLFCSHGDANARRNGEAHRHVIRRSDELRLSCAANADRAEDGVTDIGNDAAALVEM